MKSRTSEELRSLVEKYPWWSGARMELLRREIAANGTNCPTPDAHTSLLAQLHPTAIIPLRTVDVSRLTQLTADDLIDRFLKRDDYRIVAEDGSAEDLAQVEIEDEEDMVSEDLAEIYLAQGLKNEAIEIYRKLSLLNSEKSVYFAGLIAEIEEKKKR